MAVVVLPIIGNVNAARMNPPANGEQLKVLERGGEAFLGRLWKCREKRKSSNR